MRSIFQTSKIRVSPFSARTVVTRSGPIDLEYDKLVPSNGNETENALVIMHGLLYVLFYWLILVFLRCSMQRNEEELAFSV